MSVASSLEFLHQRVSRVTAGKHLRTLALKGIVDMKKISRQHFYINRPLFDLLTKVTLNDLQEHFCYVFNS